MQVMTYFTANLFAVVVFEMGGIAFFATQGHMPTPESLSHFQITRQLGMIRPIDIQKWLGVTKQLILKLFGVGSLQEWVYISYILMSNFDFTGNMSASLSSDKLGVTTTVKEQVENIEGAIVFFKSCIDMQKKQQGELQLQLKKLDEKTHRQFSELLREITDRAAQLSDIFRNENQKQSKEFQYMQLQGGILTEQHQKLNQINGELGSRTGSMQGVVGV